MKVICVPKDKAAQNRLNFDECNADELIELKLEDETFYKLFNMGFFNSINTMIGSIIDDYEDESIRDSTLLKKILDSNLFDKQSYPIVLQSIIAAINNLFDEALKRGTGVYFYF